MGKTIAGLERIQIGGAGGTGGKAQKEQGRKKEIKQILTEYQKKYRVVVRTSFAFGADQLIVQCAIELGITIKGAIPFELEEYIKNIKEDSQD